MLCGGLGMVFPSLVLPVEREPQTLPFPPPSSGEQKREWSWVEIRAICWKQKYDDKESNNSTSINYRSVQRECDLHAKMLNNEKQWWTDLLPATLSSDRKRNILSSQKEKNPFPLDLEMVLNNIRILTCPLLLIWTGTIKKSLHVILKLWWMLLLYICFPSQFSMVYFQFCFSHSHQLLFFSSLPFRN